MRFQSSLFWEFSERSTYLLRKMASEKASAPNAPPPQGGYPEAPPSYAESMGAAGKYIFFKRINSKCSKTLEFWHSMMITYIVDEFNCLIW